MVLTHMQPELIANHATLSIGLLVVGYGAPSVRHTQNISLRP